MKVVQSGRQTARRLITVYLSAYMYASHFILGVLVRLAI